MELVVVDVDVSVVFERALDELLVDLVARDDSQSSLQAVHRRVPLVSAADGGEARYACLLRDQMAEGFVHHLFYLALFDVFRCSFGRRDQLIFLLFFYFLLGFHQSFSLEHFYLCLSHYLCVVRHVEAGEHLLEVPPRSRGFLRCVEVYSLRWADRASVGLLLDERRDMRLCVRFYCSRVGESDCLARLV